LADQVSVVFLQIRFDQGILDVFNLVWIQDVFGRMLVLGARILGFETFDEHVFLFLKGHLFSDIILTSSL
jgi:hypothetical protein